MLAFISKRPRMCALTAAAVAGAVLAASSTPPASPRAPPPEFPVIMLQELSADIAANPEPSADLAQMTPAEAAEITASPVGRTWLDICRARRATLAGYLDAWGRMTDGQRAAIIAVARATPEESTGACASRFRDAVGERKRRDAIAAADIRRALAAANVPEPVPVVHRRLSSASECQWWRDEIERDDHEAYVASTRDLREGWDHNRLQAQNAYRDACQ